MERTELIRFLDSALLLEELDMGMHIGDLMDLVHRSSLDDKVKEEMVERLKELDRDTHAHARLLAEAIKEACS